MSIRANDTASEIHARIWLNYEICLLYTSDAADE